jgi:hypothetical protein
MLDRTIHTINMSASFEHWLGKILGQDHNAVRRLIKDPTGLHFLMAWSLFESKCCGGEFDANKHCGGDSMPVTDRDESEAIAEEALYFHQRYQSPHLLESLAPLSKSSKKARNAFVQVLELPREGLADVQARIITVFVCSRVRNNMFHGVKGIDDWLRDGDLIRRCTTVLQHFVAARERQHPTLAVESVASAA